MLETRNPPVSTLPRPAGRASARTGAARVAIPPPAPRPARHVARPPRTASARVARLARSEARLLAVAVVGTALMCAVLVIYLAAYARVSQLGVDAARARVQLRLVRLENDQLQARLASLQSPSRIAAAAQALGMTAGGRRATYITPQTIAPQAPQGDARNVQVANGGTAPDDTATDGH